MPIFLVLNPLLKIVYEITQQAPDPDRPTKTIESPQHGNPIDLKNSSAEVQHKIDHSAAHRHQQIQSH
jgi:hypothetical protein